MYVLVDCKYGWCVVMKASKQHRHKGIGLVLQGTNQSAMIMWTKAFSFVRRSFGRHDCCAPVGASQHQGNTFV